MNNPQDLLALINHWCPKSPAFDQEDTNVRLIRALMCANAASLDLRRVVEGKQPICDLSFYPVGHGS